MSVAEDLADRLALDTLALIDATGDDAIISELSRTLEASSTQAHEAFMSAIRVRMAMRRARDQLEARRKAAGQAPQGGD